MVEKVLTTDTDSAAATLAYFFLVAVIRMLSDFGLSLN